MSFFISFSLFFSNTVIIGGVTLLAPDDVFFTPTKTSLTSLMTSSHALTDTFVDTRFLDHNRPFHFSSIDPVVQHRYRTYEKRDTVFIPPSFELDLAFPSFVSLFDSSKVQSLFPFPSEVSSLQFKLSAIESTPHAPILINGDDDLLHQAAHNGWSGDGSLGNPILITGYSITSSGDSAITIYSTSLHIQISNCILIDGGITLGWVSNTELSNNDITLSGGIFPITDWGIYLFHSSSNFILNNRITTPYVGIYLETSPLNIVCFNELFGCSLLIFGDPIDTRYQVLVSDNLVDNRPLIYLQNAVGKVITGVAGQIILINCDSIDLLNLDLTGPYYLLYCCSSTNINIRNSIFYEHRGPAITLESCSYVNVEDNTIYSSSIGLSSHGSDYIFVNRNFFHDYYRGIYFHQTNHSEVIDNTLDAEHTGSPPYDLDSQGIILRDTEFNNISRNIITDNSYYGIHLSDSQSSNISHNSISYGSLHGIFFENSDNNLISDNLVYNNDEAGIYLWQSAGNLLDANTVYNHLWEGIGINESPFNTLTNNIVYSNRDGLGIWYTYDITVIDNKFFSNLDGAGIAVFESSNCVLSSNNASFNQYSGIYGENSHDCHFEFNYVHDSLQTAGIDLYSSDNAIISNNFVYQNALSGITLAECTNADVSSNTVFLNGRAGVACMFAPANTVTSNNIDSNRHGIVLYFSDSCIVTQNQVSNSQYAGLYISRSISSTVLDNSFLNDGLYYWCSDFDQSLQLEVAGNTFNSKPIIFLQNQVGGTIPAGAGQIFLIHCRGILVEDQDLSDAIVGLHAAFSSNLRLVSNIFSNNLDEGFWLYNTNSSLIMDNNIFQNGYGGLGLYSSHNNTLSSNYIHNNVDSDLILGWFSTNNSVFYNNFVSNDFRGLFIEEGSDNNRISWNNFLDNNDGNCQAADNGEDNVFLANHWNDHTTPDVDGNGIVDIAYPIDGLTGNTDPSPYVLANGWTVLPTETGTDVKITEPGTGIDLIFDTVDISGTTSVTVLDEAPESPTGFEVTGINYDISTTATFTGLVEVAIPYDETLVPGDEADLVLLHWDDDGQIWEDVTAWVDTVNNIIYGEVVSFSIIALMLSFDLVPPITELNLENYFVDDNGEIYVTSSSTFYLIATDLKTGVATSYYRINSGDWFTYTTPFSLTDSPDGMYIIDFFSVDNAGNEEIVQSFVVHLRSAFLCSHLGEEDGTTISYFDVIFSKYLNEGYKLIVTNPGQIFYFLEFHHTFPISIESTVLNLFIPADFVMKGTHPIYVYSEGVDITELCIISGSIIFIPDISPETVIQVVVHLDYGLKGEIFNSLEDYGMKNYPFLCSLDTFITETFSGVYSSESTLLSDQKKTTSIAGFVTDAAGIPLSGVQVTLHDLAGNFLGYTTFTAEDGFYYFINIEIGEYLVRVTLSPGIFVEIQAIAISNELVQVDFVLEM